VGKPRGLYGGPVRKDFTPLLSSRETRIAVIGASDNLEKYGSIIYRDLKARGYRMLAVNPSRDSVDDDPCYPTLRDLPERPDILDFVVPAHIGLKVARTAAEISLNNVWLQPGAESAELIDYLEESGLDYDYDSCIMVSARHARRR
jgi:predicted CoA-binding protein